MGQGRRGGIGREEQGRGGGWWGGEEGAVGRLEEGVEGRRDCKGRQEGVFKAEAEEGGREKGEGEG